MAVNQSCVAPSADIWHVDESIVQQPAAHRGKPVSLRIPVDSLRVTASSDESRSLCFTTNSHDITNETPLPSLQDGLLLEGVVESCSAPPLEVVMVSCSTLLELAM